MDGRRSGQQNQFMSSTSLSVSGTASDSMQMPVAATTVNSDAALASQITRAAQFASTMSNVGQTIRSSQGSRRSSITDADRRSIAETSGIEDAPYYHGMMSREQIAELLIKDGDFAVRSTDVDDKPYLVLSVYWNKTTHHVVIMRTDSGKFRLRDQRFDSVPDLIAHYERNKLPVSDAGALLKRGIKQQDWQLSHSKITLNEKIGEGEFGQVWKGTLNLGGFFNHQIDVAVKTLNDPFVIKKDRVRFMREASLMRQLRHKNIVRMYGVALHRTPIMIVMQLAINGSLLARLRDFTIIVSTADRVRYSKDAASGLAYLERQRVIHRDVAARNCLLGEKGEVKISDFGLSLGDTTEHRERGVALLPVRWLAPETLARGVFTNKSDVWSFGVLLFEIFSDGTVPFKGLRNAEVRDKVLKENLRLRPPVGTPEEVARLMAHCWMADPNARPDFESMRKQFKIIAKMKRF